MRFPEGKVVHREPAKRCTRCDETMDLSMFHRRSRSPDGRQGACKSCRAALDRERYATTDMRLRLRERNKERHRRAMEALLDYLSDKQCVDCGCDDPQVLEFDHLRDKRADVSVMVGAGLAWRTILEEIGKCEVVCANCHRVRTLARVGGLRAGWQG